MKTFMLGIISRSASPRHLLFRYALTRRSIYAWTTAWIVGLKLKGGEATSIDSLLKALNPIESVAVAPGALIIRFARMLSSRIGCMSIFLNKGVKMKVVMI